MYKQFKNINNIFLSNNNNNNNNNNNENNPSLKPVIIFVRSLLAHVILVYFLRAINLVLIFNVSFHVN